MVEVVSGLSDKSIYILPVLFAPMVSACISPFKLVYLLSRVWLKKIPTAWGGIATEGERDVEREV